MSRLEAQLLASKWMLTLQRHRSDLAELEREIVEFAERCGVVRPTDRTELDRQRRAFWRRPNEGDVG